MNAQPQSSERVPALEAVIAEWIARTAGAEGAGWYRTMTEQIRSAGDDRALVKATGLAPRKLGKADLAPDAPEKNRLEALRPGFDATGLSVDQLARIGFVLATWRGSDHAFATLFDDLCRTAEINELVAYYRGLPLYPGAPLLLNRAREGLRSGMKPVFEAVAHRSPYPREMLDEHSWNQMVLKALFIDSTLAPIQGLDERGNRDLAGTLIDYAHERWAAHRSINPELWRCVVPFADEAEVETLLRQAADAKDDQSLVAIKAFRDRA